MLLCSNIFSNILHVIVSSIPLHVFFIELPFSDGRGTIVTQIRVAVIADQEPQPSLDTGPLSQFQDRGVPTYPRVLPSPMMVSYAISPPFTHPTPNDSWHSWIHFMRGWSSLRREGCWGLSCLSLPLSGIMWRSTNEWFTIHPHIMMQFLLACAPFLNPLEEFIITIPMSRYPFWMQWLLQPKK